MGSIYLTKVLFGKYVDSEILIRPKIITTLQIVCEL